MIHLKKVVIKKIAQQKYKSGRLSLKSHHDHQKKLHQDQKVHSDLQKWHSQKPLNLDFQSQHPEKYLRDQDFDSCYHFLKNHLKPPTSLQVPSKLPLVTSYYLL